jgi:hypothetical protein
MIRKSSGAGTGSSRRALRLVWLALTVAIMALFGAWAAIGVSAMMQTGHPLRAAALAIGTLFLMLLGLLAAAAQWRGAGGSDGRPIVPPDAGEPTGIWGVGGPSMREPGSTGGWSTRRVDRRYENPED